MVSRRNFLQAAAGTGFAAAALAAFPPSIRKALASWPTAAISSR